MAKRNTYYWVKKDMMNFQKFSSVPSENTTENNILDVEVLDEELENYRIYTAMRNQTENPVDHNEKESQLKNLNLHFEEESYIDEALRLWANYYRITQRALSSLLRISHKQNQDLPKCSKTLKKTPKKAICESMDNGNFFYVGFEDGIQKYLFNLNILPTELKLNFGIDGLPISRSSKNEFWPIL